MAYCAILGLDPFHVHCQRDCHHSDHFRQKIEGSRLHVCDLSGSSWFCGKFCVILTFAMTSGAGPTPTNKNRSVHIYPKDICLLDLTCMVFGKTNRVAIQVRVLAHGASLLPAFRLLEATQSGDAFRVLARRKPQNPRISQMVQEAVWICEPVDLCKQFRTKRSKTIIKWPTVPQKPFVYGKTPNRKRERTEKLMWLARLAEQKCDVVSSISWNEMSCLNWIPETN